jgi:hypothetical protein
MPKLYKDEGGHLVRPAKLLSYQVIIRAIHQRGEDQANCLAELARRGLWLTDDQRIQAGLPCLPPRSLPRAKPEAE